MLLLLLLLLGNIRVALAATLALCKMRLMSYLSSDSCSNTIGWLVASSQTISLTRRTSAWRSS